MKLFSLIQLKYDEFTSAVRARLSELLGSNDVSMSNSSIFNQLINVVSSAIQNVLTYIEDSLMEHNKYTAQRKRSIYNLASISGYQPSTGTATTSIINIAFKPNNSGALDVIIPNKTKLLCSNGLIYNILLPQEAIVLSPSRDNISRDITIVEGRFESQSTIVKGGPLYTINFKFGGDIDTDYARVFVNNELWEYRDSLYDMDAEGKQYTMRTSLSSGVDVIFGDFQNGRELRENDEVRIEYLLHTGEIGTLNPQINNTFEFMSPLHDVGGEEVNGNSIFLLTLRGGENISSGTSAEDTAKVREMIGLNSRSLVLADPKNYKQYLNRFSFVGYNRTWSEKGSLIINSLIAKNYKANLKDGGDYFKLSENDFKLSISQKNSIINNINNSGQQLAGSILNIFDPEIVKYAVYIYLKLKNNSYNTSVITSQIRKLLGDFFSNLESDIFVPKSDIIKLIKDNVEAVDGVDVYFLSQLNEQALINHSYYNKIYRFDPSLGTYKIYREKIYLYDGEDPGLGLDAHGNIYLDNADQFPVLMGGWSFISSDTDQNQTTYVDDPVTIIFE